MPRKPTRPKKEKQLTKNQQLWQKEINRLKKRANSWKNKFHAVVPIPEMPKRITEKALQELRNLKWKQLSEEAKTKFRENYQRLYDEADPSVYKPTKQYKPKTEKEWLNTPEPPPVPQPEPEPEQDIEDETGYKEVVDSYDEIAAWIEENINLVEQKDGYKSWEIDPSERESIAKWAQDAAVAAGYSEEYYKYLEEHAKDVNELVRKYIYGYVTKRGRVIRPESNGQELSNILTILNYGRPIDAYQSMELDETGYVTFDMTDID